MIPREVTWSTKGGEPVNLVHIIEGQRVDPGLWCRVVALLAVVLHEGEIHLGVVPHGNTISLDARDKIILEEHPYQCVLHQNAYEIVACPV